MRNIAKMRNIELKRKGEYSMVLRMHEVSGFRALYVVKNFCSSKPDGQQWDCSEYYGSNACNGDLHFAAAERAVEKECLRLSDEDDVIPGLYCAEFKPTNTECIILADSMNEALENAKTANGMVGAMPPDEEDDESDPVEGDDNYIVEEMSFYKLCNLISRRASAYWGNDGNSSIIFDD